MVEVKHGWAKFRFYNPQAHRVSLAGDFNGWSTDRLPMVRSPEGYWKAKVHLPTGTFRFRYCADGHWFTDFAAFGVEPGPYGPVSVVWVPSTKASQDKR